MSQTFEERIRAKIESLKNQVFNKDYIIECIYKSFLCPIPPQQLDFLKIPFSKEIINFYVKTCKLPEEKLSQGIFKVLGGKDGN